MRLNNAKTRSETGFEYVLGNLDIRTPYGKQVLLKIKPFMPGAEPLLRKELERTEQIYDMTVLRSDITEIMHEIFMEIKDVSFSIERSKTKTLSVVEMFEIKNLLLQEMRLIEIFAEAGSRYIPEEWIPESTGSLLDVLDPQQNRINTFYIYDEFSTYLADLRRQKHNMEKEVRRSQKQAKTELEKLYQLSFNPQFELIVTKSDEKLLQKVCEIQELTKLEEDYATITFKIKTSSAVMALRKKIEDVHSQIDEEELRVREMLSAKIGEYADILQTNCEKIGKLDFCLAKALYAKNNHCVKPEITEKHRISFTGGRHLQVEQALQARNKTYCPIDLDIAKGVICITGANMGGKTVSLKLIGLVTLLAQHGFFVPCESAVMGLSSYIHLLIGDSQSTQRGLSSFGGEMEELKEILDNSRDRALLLIDEIANGTNPAEGLALTKGIVRYLLGKEYITVATTHFDSVTSEFGVRNMQVRGLADVDFKKLEKELRYANRKERITIIGKYMDYRLYSVQNSKEVPKDALNIAHMLGIYPEIIEYAKEVLKEDVYEQVKS